MLVLVAILSLAVGAVLGLLGGGGSILALPMFAYVAGQEPRAAIAGSLLMVGSTSAAGVLLHARRGKVRLLEGAVFGAGGVAGAWAGSKMAAFVPGTALLVGFGIVMLAAASAMLRGRATPVVPRRLSWSRAVLVGAGVGVLAGLLGAGGGFLIVPALVLAGGLEMPQAAATSLLIIAMQSFAGFAGHTGDVRLDVPLLLVTSAGGVLGTLVGVRLGRHMTARGLRRSFAWLTLGVSLAMLAAELRSVIPLAVLVPALLLAGAAAVAAGRRRPSRPIPVPEGAST